MQAMEISRTALDVEWRRLEITAGNLANVESAGNGTTPLYRERTLLSGTRPLFSSYLDSGLKTSGIDAGALSGVDIYGVEESNAPPRLVHEPGSRLADARGMVAYPNVDHAAQMLLMVRSSRSYEANVVAMNAAREMYSRALDIGRRG
jgi:flagellar basal-body rod protein FlgC